MAVITASKRTSSSSFSQWFLGHLLASPLNLLIISVGTSLSILIRMLFPIFLGQTLDQAIIDQQNLLTNKEQFCSCITS
jgi:hypothetical protein